MGVHSYGTMGVDWEERVRFDRLRDERLARIKALLAGVRPGRAAVLRHDQHPLHHRDPHRHVGAWTSSTASACCPRATSRSCGTSAPPPATTSSTTRGSATGRSRAGHLDAARRDVAATRAAPEDVAQQDQASSSRSAGCSASRSASTSIEPPVLFALQAEGIQVVDGQQLMQQARRHQDARRDPAAQHARASMVDAAYEELYRAMRPGLPRERVRRASSTRCSTTWARSTSRASTRSPASAARPHPHVFTDRALRPGDPAYFDILHSYMGYRTCYYRTFAVGSASPALVDAYKRCRDYLDAAIALIRPGATTGEVVEVWPEAQEFGFPDEEAAFALQYGHGVGLSIWEKPIFSRLVSLDHPEEIRGGHGLRAGDLLAGVRRLVARRASRSSSSSPRTAARSSPGSRPRTSDRRAPLPHPGGPLPSEREVESHRNTELDPVGLEAAPRRSVNGRTAVPD